MGKESFNSREKEKMNRIYAIAALVLISIVVANASPFVVGARPSDFIMPGPKPAMIQLSGTSVESLMAIASLNAPLPPYQPWELPDLGHYHSYNATVAQEDYVGATENMTDFLQSSVPVAEDPWLAMYEQNGMKNP